MGPEFHGIHIGKPLVSDLVKLSTFKVTLGPIWPRTGGASLFLWKDPSIWRYLKKDLGDTEESHCRPGLVRSSAHALTFGPVHLEEKFWLSVTPEKESSRFLCFSAQCTHQDMNDKLTDFLNLGAPVIQALSVCLQESPSMWTPAVLPHPGAALLRELLAVNFKILNYFTGRVIHGRDSEWVQTDPLRSDRSLGLAGSGLEGDGVSLPIAPEKQLCP